MGTPLGHQCYKIRLAVKSKGKGKSGGLRVITWVIVELQSLSDERIEVVLATIFDKSEYESLPSDELKSLLREIDDERNL